MTQLSSDVHVKSSNGLSPRLCLKDLNLKGKRVLMRVDFNVPLDDEGRILDDTRIQACLPSIRFVLESGASLILMSHLGRPKLDAKGHLRPGQNPKKLSLSVCAKKLEEILEKEVFFAPFQAGDLQNFEEETLKKAKNLKEGQVLLLENLRFLPGESFQKTEKTKDASQEILAKTLASFGHVFVNEAFGTSHRKSASITTLPKFFPSLSAAGLLLEKEMEHLSSLHSAQKPFYAIIGGSKVSSKISVLKSLLPKVQGLFIGGGMAFTFLKAKGMSIGNSLFEKEMLPLAKEMFNLCEKQGIALHLPLDFQIADSFSNLAQKKVVTAQEGISSPWMGLDIGPQTLNAWEESLKKAQTVFWNGPLGVFEFSQFAKGSLEMAKSLAHLKAKVIVGGGDSLAALKQAGCMEKIDFVSTGGGASLEFLEKGTLPGIEALSLA